MQPVSKQRFRKHVPTRNNIGSYIFCGLSPETVQSCAFYVVCATQQYRAVFSMWSAPRNSTELCFLCGVRHARVQCCVFYVVCATQECSAVFYVRSPCREDIRFNVVIELVAPTLVTADKHLDVQSKVKLARDHPVLHPAATEHDVIGRLFHSLLTNET
jgi:hypothetical protein